ncbi:MAG TPA: 3-deoxy-D-manno-octulosonic acid transferase [Acidobacteriota bacterium]|jgi:3-deoxy-D-manno-octulosonic-acid transferase
MFHRLLYNVVLWTFFLFYSPVFFFRMFRQRKRVGALRQRFGVVPRLAHPSRPRIWLHAVSVGEIMVLQPLIQKLKEENLSVVISTTTATGNHLARRLYSDLAEAVIFFPFDFNFAVRGSLNAIKPDLFALVETEIWPNFLWNCARRGISAFLINGRISDRSYPRYQMIQRLLAPSLKHIERFCMQSAKDAQRMIELGADPARVRITGNLKYDIEPRQRQQQLNLLIREVLGVGPKVPLLVAGSTAPGEEAMLLESVRQIRKSNIDLKVVIAPRNPERFQDVAGLLTAHGMRFTRRSFFSEYDLAHPLKSEVRYDAFLLDSIGELTGVYEAATIVFVGKSLVPGGGHNIVEPAFFGKPILFGPYMENFQEIADTFLQQNAAIQVMNPADLTQQMHHLLRNRDVRISMGERASRIISDNRGAAVHTLQEIRELVVRKPELATRGTPKPE